MMEPPDEVPSDGESVEMGVEEHERATGAPGSWALSAEDDEESDDEESGNGNGASTQKVRWAGVEEATTEEDEGNGSFRKKKATKGIPYCDHYSLQYPSSTIRFRTSKAAHRVYEGNRTQFVLEETDDQVVVKRVRDTTAGVYVLRAIYTGVAILWSGFLFIFCTQLLIFLVMDLASYLGATTGSGVAIGQAIGSILSFPLFVHGLASALIIDGHFVADTWCGGYLMKTLVFGGMASVLSAWLTFGFYFGLPLLVMCICLLAGVADWWKITALFWFSSLGVFYIMFVAVIIYFEIRACFELVTNNYDCGTSQFALLKQSILLRQVNIYSGYKQRVFLARGSLREISTVRESLVQDTDKYRQSPYSCFTQWRCLEKIGMYERLVPPGQLMHPIEESSGVRPFVTYNTWSLEKLYCRPRNSWMIAVIKGPAALTRAQMRSSFVCSILGVILTCLIFISFLVYFGAGWAIIGVLIALMVVCCFPRCHATFRAFNMAKDLAGFKAPSLHMRQQDISEAMEDTGDTDDEEDEEEAAPALETSTNGIIGREDSEGVFQVCVTYRTTKATDRLCWTMFFFEIALLFLYPLVSLFLTGDVGVGCIFLVLGLFSIIRYYCNAAVVLEEVGNMKALQGKDEHQKWQNRSRTNDIVTNVTRSRSRGPWIAVLGFFFFLCLALVIAGLRQGDTTESSAQITLVPGFSYEREQNSLPYPTCELDFNGGIGRNDGVVATPDFSFVAAMAYETNATKLQEQYDTWFGPGNATNRPEVVSAFRTETNRKTSPVTYNLATFPSASADDPVGIVSIRGSQNAWDWLTNAQLWSAALGMQFLQSFLPFGFVWRPIMDELVKGISIVESESLQRVSYYVETTDFIQWLQASGNYSDVKTTGHSLGGGLAIISAAQTATSGIAISGPNAMLTRKAVNPEISADELNTFTFNVIPDGDFVPMVGGVAQMYENIVCTAPDSDLFGCHSASRTLCELLYKCGSGNRPILCECVYEFGYPEPISSTGESFAEACSALR